MSKKGSIVVLIILLMFALTPGAYIQGQSGDPAVMAGDWLKTQQAENGSFSDEIGATALSIIALATLGETNDAAVTWLEENISEDLELDQASLAIIALVATDIDPSTFADGSLLGTYSGQLRQARGEQIDALCLGLIARYDLDLPLPDIAITSLIGLQNEDGGFGAARGNASDIVTTSLCVHVLAAAEQTDSLERALAYLSETQLDDHGWSIDSETTTSDALATALVLQALTAAEQTLADWNSPERTLFGFLDFESGAFMFGDGEDTFLNLISTAVAIPIFRGKSLISFASTAEEVNTGQDSSETVMVEGPALDANWGLVGNGFGMDELNTADDFFVTVIDPFANDELYGIEIINWTAEYQYTGYIVQNFLPAEVLLWMAEQDPSVWEKISPATLKLLPLEVLSQLPAEVQARAAEQ